MPISHHAQLLLTRSKGKSGISPVIAAVILVAIAVVLAASLSGFASSLVGTYSYTPMITVESLELREDGTGKIVFYNSGARGDAVVSLQAMPNSPMGLSLSDGTTVVNSGGDVAGGGNTGSNNGGSNDPAPNCTEHSDAANCMHDQDKGNSGSSSGHQNNPSGGSNSNGNSGGSTNTGSGQSNGPGGNNGLNQVPVGIFLPPNSETTIDWSETSVGEFGSGEMVTVQVYFESGNRLTFSTLVS